MLEEKIKSNMYFIAIVLPAHLDTKIREYKTFMQERYGCKVGLKSPAHITLIAPFWMEVDKEENLKQDMVQIGQSSAVFPVRTADFSAFKPRTIFVAVEENGVLNNIKKTTDSVFKLAAYNMKMENRPFHPHITIATRDLHKKDFAEAWPRFEKDSFQEEFEATDISLLKHNGRNWDVVFLAPFRTP